MYISAFIELCRYFGVDVFTSLYSEFFFIVLSNRARSWWLSITNCFMAWCVVSDPWTLNSREAFPHDLWTHKTLSNLLVLFTKIEKHYSKWNNLMYAACRTSRIDFKVDVISHIRLGIIWLRGSPKKVDEGVQFRFSIGYPWLWKMWSKTYPWLGTSSLLLAHPLWF